MFSNRPPSASPTPESREAWAHHHYTSSTSSIGGGLGQSLAPPPMSGGPGPGPGPNSYMYHPDQQYSAQQSQGGGAGGGGRRAPSRDGVNATSPYNTSNSPFLPTSSALGSGQSNRGGTGGPHPGQSTTPQPPGQSSLLLNNLAQHLNNPPAPSPTYSNPSIQNPNNMAGGGAGGSGGMQQGHQGMNQAAGGGGGGGGQNQGLLGSLAQGQGGGAGAGVGAQGMLVGLAGGAGVGGSGSAGAGVGAGAGAGSAGAAGAVGKLLLLPNGSPPPAGSEEEKIYILITELLDPETREMALLDLSKKREMYEDLALVLWGGFGIMSSLLLEIVNVYPALSPPSLTAHASNRVCNALALLQCVASHSETRSLFLNAHIPLFLYPFLNTTSKTRPFEYLRLTSLGVIGALVKQNENSDVINFLLSTEIIPLCLRIMETGSELSKTVAIFIVQKILLDDLGLQYICQTYERFYAVGAVLANMVQALVESQAVRLLKHVVRCYLRMSDNPRAREALRACLPEALKDNTFAGLLKGDMVTRRCLSTLLHNLNERPGQE